MNEDVLKRHHKALVELSARVKELEAQLESAGPAPRPSRLWNILTAIACLLLLGWSIVLTNEVFLQNSTGEAGLVRASEIQLVDADGRMLAQLGVNRSGGGALVLWSKDGTRLAALEEGPNAGGQLAVFNEQSNPIAYLGSGTSDQGILITRNRDGAKLVETNGFRNGGGSITTWLGDQPLVDIGVGGGAGMVEIKSGGVTVASLGATEDGGGYIAAHGDKGNELAALRGGHDVAEITIKDPAGSALVQLAGFSGQGVLRTMNKSGATVSIENGIGLWNEAGKQVVGIAATSNGSGSITTMNANGKATIHVGQTTNTNGVVIAYSDQGKELVRIGGSDEGAGYVVVEDTRGAGQRNWLQPLP